MRSLVLQKLPTTSTTEQVHSGRNFAEHKKHHTRCFGKDGSEHRKHQNQFTFSLLCIRRSTATFGNFYATVSLKQNTLFHRYTYQAPNWCAKNIRHYSRFFTTGAKHTQRGNQTKKPCALERNCNRLLHRITFTTITLPYNWRNSNPSIHFWPTQAKATFYPSTHNWRRN